MGNYGRSLTDDKTTCPINLQDQVQSFTNDDTFTALGTSTKPLAR